MKNKVFLLALGLIGLFLIAFLYLKQNFKSDSTTNTQATTSANATAESAEGSQFSVVPAASSQLIKPHSMIKGKSEAKVTVVEFLDPECEACAAMHPIVKKIAQEFENDLKIVVRYMPLHRNSNYVANILEGVRDQNKYWETLELLFETQDQWANHHQPKPELIPEILKPLKISNIDKIIADAKAGKYDKQIAEDKSDAQSLGVNGTPTFFVDGHPLQELGYGPLKAAIEEKIKRE